MVNQVVKEVLHDSTTLPLEGKLGDFMVYRCYKDHLKMFYLSHKNQVKHMSEEVITFSESNNLEL